MRNELITLLGDLARSRLPKLLYAIFALSLAVTLAVGITQNVYRTINTPPPRFIASVDVWKLGMVTGSAGTAAALLITIYVADRNYRRGREHVPNLTMDLQITRTPVTRSLDAVILTLNAKNTGTGLCEVGRVDWTIKTLSPYSDGDISNLIQEMQRKYGHSARNFSEFPWQEAVSASVKPAVAIEPNETGQLTHDFLMPPEITAIVASVWVENATADDQTQGWYRRAVHIQQEA